ncbi:hypothetical protein EQG49_10810 [Periweissella cryptocerci]|uniref:Putative zinc ribbon domain-containing protein n=1 Tax=Periweissella cryptocerci TaxID=2506420 RepID=A0A4P6YVY9_9LACO|nr:zinc ribbon domain-containing protein [Periweissella cryptocerci]QBO36897.1 hypothetical protein EQG49_10810 [Periweissella cryptocerci]
MAQKVFCQSCGMPLQNKADFGTNKDGSFSTEYCSYCYLNGEFVDPNATVASMIAVGEKGIEQNPQMGKITKFFLKKMYPMQVKNLKRWK